VTRRGWFLFTGLALIWGVPYLLIRVAVREMPPAVVVFGRTTIGASLLLPFVLRRGHLARLLTRWRPILAFTVVEIGLPWFFLSDAERRISSSAAGLLVACVPIAGALISRFSGRAEGRLGWSGMAGLAVGLAGVAALVGLDVSAQDGWAIAEMLVVVLGYAVGPIIVSRALADLPSLEVVAVSLAAGALAYAPAAAAQLPPRWPAPAALAAVAALGVLCTAAAFLMFFELIAEVGPIRATVVTYLNPAVAVAAGVGLGGERFTSGTAVAFVLILAGSYLATRATASVEEVEDAALEGVERRASRDRLA
jgi:drug/metabolite transporter (DMT)-like permease